MASTQRRSTSDASNAASTFSYAQAAKGMAAPASSGGNASKPASGTATPAKDSIQPSGGASNAPSNSNWADDAETQSAPAPKESDGPSAEQESLPNGVPSQKAAASQQASTASVISSPDLGTASSSTLGKDDDIASIQNASSESTWENKSQTSNVEKKDSTQDTSSEKEKAPLKALQDAPIPAVNVWKLRADDFAKARTTAASSTAKKSEGAANGPQAKAGDETTRKSKLDDAHLPSAPGKDRRQNPDGRRSKEDDYAGLGRRDTRPDGDSKRRAAPRGKDVPSAPLPPTKDQESWPTPESAQDEEKRRNLEKGEKEEKGRTAAPAPRPHGKSEWVQIPYTPSVVFNTPMPNAAARRGGRGGARGGSQATGRGGSYSAAGVNAVSGERDNAPNGDNAKRGKPEGSAKRDQSPSRSKSANGGAAPWKEQKASAAVDRSVKPAEGQNDAQENKKSSSEESAAAQAVSQTSGPRSLPIRQKMGRKPDSPSERRREGEGTPSRDNASPSYNRRVSAATQNEGENQGPKSAGPERRSGPFGSYSGREREPRGRGGMRGGRGNMFSNSSHTNGQPYVNGNSSGQPGSFSNPKSPTAFYPEQAGNYFSGSQRSYGRNGARSQSVSADGMYGRVPQGGFPSGQNLPPLNTFMNGPYEYQMMQPMSAVPWTPYFGQDQVFHFVTTQIEYYFSIDNLCKDMFLRKHMDSQGFVFLSFIADFNRIKQITTDLEVIKLACYHSREIEYRVGSDGKDRLRRREGWEQWRLPLGERHASAQNDGPAEVHHPPVPHPQGFGPGFDPYTMRFQMGPMSGPTSPGGTPHDPAFAGMNGVAMNGTVPSGPNGEPVAFPHPGNPSEGAAVYPGHHGAAVNGDSFSDEQVESLSVISRKQDPALAAGKSRSFSNGSINGHSHSDELQNAEPQQNGAQLNGHVPAQVEERIGTPDPKSPPSLGPNDKYSSPYPVKLFWVKDKETPVDQLPDESTCELYTDLRSKALGQRQAAASGTCPYDMDVLYQFWSHFLIRNFNTRMYDEFRQLAYEDAHQRMSDNGMKNLMKYYGEALKSHSTIRERIARHCVELVRSEDPSGDRPAFEQLRSAWISSDLPVENRNRIAQFIDDGLKSRLEE